MAKLATLSALLALIPFATAQASEWGQCGGNGWTGPTTCVSNYSCVHVNEWYYQCQPAASSTSTQASTSTGAPLPTGTSTTGLSIAAKAAGKVYFGTATDNPELSDTSYKALLGNTKEFTAITVGNSMKWDSTEPSRGVFTFDRGDVIAQLAKANGQLLRGHTCVWHSQLPNWVTAGNFNNATLIQIVNTHTTNVVSRWKDQVYAWDVINEPFNEDGTFRQSVFYNTIGQEYIAIALRTARAADPKAKLYINDYNIDTPGAKSTGMYNLVKSLKSRGVPIDGIGIQGHLILGTFTSDSIQQNLEQFASLDVDVAFTELDIRMDLPVTPEKLQAQKRDYQAVVKACKAVKRCIGITVWDYTDKFSWIPSVFDGQGAALPWDEQLVKKPAYDGIIDGWRL